MTLWIGAAARSFGIILVWGRFSPARHEPVSNDADCLALRRECPVQERGNTSRAQHEEQRRVKP